MAPGTAVWRQDDTRRRTQPAGGSSADTQPRESREGRPLGDQSGPTVDNVTALLMDYYHEQRLHKH